jgi:hypothetical protein
MPTQPESPAAVIGTSSKTLQLLRKMVRQLLHVMLVLTICLAVAATALAIWWLTSLNGLPDIGDPFDVATVRAVRIANEQNAFAFFRHANERMGRIPLSSSQLDSAGTVAWSVADPEVRAWVEANRPALELFLRGAECPDGISRRPGDPPSYRYSEDLGPRYLVKLVLLEGARRADSGDMAGAWDCYRAVLRSMALSARRTAMDERFFAGVHHGWLRRRLEAWIADPRTTIPQLRRALNEAVETRPRPEWHAFSLKLEYLQWMRLLETMHHPDFYAIQEERAYRVGDMELPQNVIANIYRVRRFLLREPERSRRAIKLLFSNWLADAEGPNEMGRRPDVAALFRDSMTTVKVPLYPVSPEAPAGARALSPRELASWLVTTFDMKLIAMQANWPSVRRAEKAAYRELFLLLATEIYRRERRALPPSDEALVGTYLTSLPDDGSAELADKLTPTVE